ncbi:MAG TPA: twin-arginine translocase subunit TatC [Tepidisphaeraceae bacterium]|jgi:sec-independent protein translocase protein TatC
MTSAGATAAESTQMDDPDQYRMSIGDHLEDLRRRLLLGIIGFVIAFVGCCLCGEQVIAIFCRPLLIAMRNANVNTQIVYTEISEPFMVYMEISMISALAIASPWILYQLWQFIAAGLYPRERKYVTKYLPLSVTLLIGGMVFLYFVVLPISMEFFLKFSSELPLRMPSEAVQVTQIPNSQPVVKLPFYIGDPPHPQEGQMWIDATQHRVKFYFDGAARVMPFGSDNLATPMITMSEYIDMVVQMLLAFGIAFQLPLVVMALVRIGIVEMMTLRRMRRIVYFGMVILAAMIIPDVVTGMFALLLPLILLYEFGIWLAGRTPPVADAL